MMGRSRPSINAPYGFSEPNDNVYPMSFKLNRENQDFFEMDEIYITFPEDNNCWILSWTLEFGDGIPKNPQQYLASFYDRFFAFES